MANAIALQVLSQGPRNAVVKATIIGDGSGDESGATLIDISALLAMGDRSEVKINRISADLAGFSAFLYWEANADVLITALPAGDSDNNYRSIGGLRNNAGAGKTGDIAITTLSLASLAGSILFELAKVEGASPIGG